MGKKAKKEPVAKANPGEGAEWVEMDDCEPGSLRDFCERLIRGEKPDPNEGGGGKNG